IGRGWLRMSRNSSAVARASAMLSRTPACAVFSRPARSAPEQKSVPAPRSRTTRPCGASADPCSASFISATSSESSALRFSGRFSVRCVTPSRVSLRILRYIDLHPQQRGAVGFALIVGAQRDQPAAIQRVMQDEVQGVQVGQLVALHLAAADAGKVLLHALGGYF